jgi:hypothetical protein
MKGLDKKAKEMLDSLVLLNQGRPLKDGDYKIVDDMYSRYEERSPHFFTQSQRDLIKKIYDNYFNPGGSEKEIRMPKEDKRLLDQMEKLIEGNELPKTSVSIAEDLLTSCREAEGLTPGRKAFVQDIIKRAKAFENQRKIYADLKNEFESGGIVTGNPAYAEDLLRQFEEKEYWTDTQQEHAEKIVNKNEDPEE